MLQKQFRSFLLRTFSVEAECIVSISIITTGGIPVASPIQARSVEAIITVAFYVKTIAIKSNHIHTISVEAIPIVAWNKYIHIQIHLSKKSFLNLFIFKQTLISQAGRAEGRLKAQFGAKSKSVFVVAVFCRTTPNSDILFNMMKELGHCMEEDIEDCSPDLLVHDEVPAVELGQVVALTAWHKTLQLLHEQGARGICLVSMRGWSVHRHKGWLLCFFVNKEQGHPLGFLMGFICSRTQWIIPAFLHTHGMWRMHLVSEWLHMISHTW